MVAVALPDPLRGDCGNCFGLCCVAPAFAASADFAIDKKAGQPCPNLQADNHCGIHGQLRDRGFTGCTVFDCFRCGTTRLTAALDLGPAQPMHPELVAGGRGPARRACH